MNNEKQIKPRHMIWVAVAITMVFFLLAWVVS